MNANRPSAREVLVLGAGYAGLRCALRLAWRDPSAAITVVDARDTMCERVRLHQVAAGQSVPRRPLAELCQDAGIAFVHARAERIDVARRVVLTSVGELRYDRLVLALGSHTDLSVPGAVEHCDRIAEEAGAMATARKLAQLRDGARVVVVGGGLTGIETVCELADARPELRFTLVTRDPLGTDLVAGSGLAHLRAALARRKIEIRDGVCVRAVEQGRLVADGEALPFDVCVWTPGFRAPALARESGLPVDAADRLRVDATLRCVAHPEIYGIGDAAIPDASGAPVLMSCRLALPMAKVAADNLAREHAPRRFTAFDILRCLSIGRDEGLVQFHHLDGRLRRFAFGGGTAAWVKERIVRSIGAVLRGEARRAASARARTPALAAASVQT